jgi:hypothetical protein
MVFWDFCGTVLYIDQDKENFVSIFIKLHGNEHNKNNNNKENNNNKMK